MEDITQAAETAVGLVLTLSDEGGGEAECRVRRHPELECGIREGAYLPVAACVTDPKALHRELESLDGVLAVDVSFVEILSSDSSTITTS